MSGSTTATLTANNPFLALIFGIILLALNFLGGSSVPPFVSSIFGAGFVGVIITVLGYYLKAGPTEDFSNDKALSTVVLSVISGLGVTGSSTFLGTPIEALTPIGMTVIFGVTVLLQWIFGSYIQEHLHIG